MTRPTPPPQRPRPWLLATLAVCCITLPGCMLFAVMAHDPDRPTAVTAQWRGLDGQAVAVIVESNSAVLSLHPTAPGQVRLNVAQRLAANVPDIDVLPDEAVRRYLEEHRGWMAYPRSRVLADLGVDRLVVIDLFEYQMHEPGNPHVRQGNIAGNINVVSAESTDPDSYAFGQTISTVWPTWNQVGTLQDSAVVEAKTLTVFAREAAGLFHDFKRPAED